MSEPPTAPQVVVTGLGPVSSIGIGVDEFRAALRDGRCGTSPIRSFDTDGFPHVYAGEVHAFAPEQIVHRLDPAEWGRSSLFAACAARLAFADAGLEDSGVETERIGVVIGTTCGETQVMEQMTAQLLEHGYDQVSPALARQVGANRLAHAASQELGAGGESLTVATACAASNYAIGFAHDAIVSGDAEVMIAGGAESVCRFVHAGFYRLGVLAEQACSPFDRDRTGILTAEGGAALVLESADHARARGARIYAEVRGYGLNCDASHMVAADPESIARCMRLAHRNAGVEPSQIDYISAHGTGTPTNDSAECWAIHEVFAGDPPPVSSIKSMIGHAMGAASGFGAIASALAINDRFLPPTINFRTPDPELNGIDPVANRSRTADVRIAQNNGFGFGGNNAIVVLGAPA
ncbi:MAG TPA: beta-ketoacyl-[acyl-carrier-protein] synthase family protein [Solirubrobacteraceae bacterium]|nr:beta-ketoacyl-[acyl-carrier-protein] synthase family protein [Solirubrobacteraceae bacterium]